MEFESKSTCYLETAFLLGNTILSRRTIQGIGILKKCLHLRLDNLIKQLVLDSSLTDEAKGSISVVYVVWEKT